MNRGPRVVSNAGPLMVLAKLNVLHLLEGVPPGILDQMYHDE